MISNIKWNNFLSITFCLAFSALYELLEWMVAELSGENADSFLGTQGYIWDTQSDMAFALLGSVASIIILQKAHNHQLKKFLV